MKKSQIFTAIFFVIITIVVFLFFFNAKYDAYKISPTMCRNLFGTTPQSFVDDGGKETIIENSYTYAKVTRKGNLLLVLSNEERDAWKNTEVVLQILRRQWDAKKDIGVEYQEYMDLTETFLINPSLRSGLELSEDYTRVTAYPDDDTSYYSLFMRMGILMQLFEGVPCDDIYVEYIEYSKNNQIQKRLVWPDDEYIIWPEESD